MSNQVEKKFTWVIQNFSSLKSKIICSDEFVTGGCKWYLEAYPKGYEVDNYLSLFLRVPSYISLPQWRRHARFLLTIVNNRSEKLSRQKGNYFIPLLLVCKSFLSPNYLDPRTTLVYAELQHWYDEKSTSWGFSSICPLDELHAKDSGFLVNGELKISAEIEILQVNGKLDVTITIFETIDVNGFQLLPSQVEVVRRVFERHPEIVSEFRPKKASLRTAYMSLLLSLIETMCQLPQELSKEDLSDAYTGLRSMKDAGFKLDWLEKKLDEMWEKKVKEEAGETRMQELEDELKDLKQKYSDIEAQLEKEKAEVSAAKAPFSFVDII